MAASSFLPVVLTIDRTRLLLGATRKDGANEATEGALPPGATGAIDGARDVTEDALSDLFCDLCTLFALREEAADLEVKVDLGLSDGAKDGA